MFSVNLEQLSDSDEEVFTGIYGGASQDISYNISRWYKYEATVILENIDEISERFPGKKYLSAEDIIEDIAYSKHGSYVLLENLRGLKKRLREIENKAKTGKWNSRYSAGLAKLNSENIDLYINDITNVAKLETLNNLIHEDLYMSYFIKTYPNIRLTEPKVPHFPSLPRFSTSIDKKKEVRKLIEETIPYLTVLERFHSAMTKLAIEVNTGMDKLISM